MPELPEVERVRRSIAAHIVGARVERAELLREDVCESFEAAKKVSTRPRELFEGAVVADVLRHGKQIAILAEDGRVMCVHLGMTGHLAFVAVSNTEELKPHTHLRWELANAQKSPTTLGRMVFTDPRRFGGVWTFPNFSELKAARWDQLGPDALNIEGQHLIGAFKGSRRAVKAALLDQAVLAGVGNIYADESLFRSKIDPRAIAARLKPEPIQRLAAMIREVLCEAIEAGGSTLRDFRDADDSAGSYQRNHQVYGRSGLPCLVCQTSLHGLVLAQRATVLCRACQSRNPR